MGLFPRYAPVRATEPELRDRRPPRNVGTGRPGAALTVREEEVLVAIVNAGSATAAAGALGVSLRTVRNTVSNMFRKTGAQSFTHLAALMFPMLSDRYLETVQRRRTRAT
jgi:DNA-binding NarL/FixJ family response regulator